MEEKGRATIVESRTIVDRVSDNFKLELCVFQLIFLLFLSDIKRKMQQLQFECQEVSIERIENHRFVIQNPIRIFQTLMIKFIEAETTLKLGKTGKGYLTTLEYEYSVITSFYLYISFFY